jgi:hypothetical protein
VYQGNVFLIPSGVCGMDYKEIKHIDIANTTAKQNPYCVETSAKLKIKKGFYDKYVIIE